MDKAQLLDLVKKGGYSQEKLLGWVNALPTSGCRKPTIVKQGDVFMHTVFKHPYILLKKRKDFWIAGLLTTEGTCPEILVECDSRFFQESFITKALFTVKDVEGTFLNNYDNNKQLNGVFNQLKHIL